MLPCCDKTGLLRQACFNSDLIFQNDDCNQDGDNEKKRSERNSKLRTHTFLRDLLDFIVSFQGINEVG